MRSTIHPAPHAEPARAARTLDNLEPPAARHIRAAYDEMAEHFVDAISATGWLTELVEAIGHERVNQEIANVSDTTPTPARTKAPAEPDDPEPTEAEKGTARRLLTLALAVLNGRRPHMREIDDRHLATVAAQRGINLAADQVTKDRLASRVRLTNTRLQARRTTTGTSIFITSMVGWNERYRALTTVITIDTKQRAKIARFNIL